MYPAHHELESIKCIINIVIIIIVIALLNIIIVSLRPAVRQEPWHRAGQGRGGAAADLHSQHGFRATGAGDQAGRQAAQHAHRVCPEEG